MCSAPRPTVPIWNLLKRSRRSFLQVCQGTAPTQLSRLLIRTCRRQQPAASHGSVKRKPLMVNCARLDSEFPAALADSGLKVPSFVLKPSGEPCAVVNLGWIRRGCRICRLWVSVCAPPPLSANTGYAMSGSYQERGAVPGGVIADAFYVKAGDIQKINLALWQTWSGHPQCGWRRIVKSPRQFGFHETGKTPMAFAISWWPAQNACAHSPLNVAEEASPEVRETPCLFCRSVVKYIIDFCLSIASPPAREHPASTAAETSKPAAWRRSWFRADIPTSWA